MEQSRRRITIWVLVGAFLPPALAYLGYVIAGTPHVACDETASTTAFYHVAVPFFAAAGLVGAAAVAKVSRIGRPARPWVANAVTGLAVAVALDALLPGALHHPAATVVAVLGVATFFGAVLTFPVTVALAGWTTVSLVRRRHRGTPEGGERRLYVALLAWSVATVLPALIVGLSLNADPLCFSF